MLIVTLAFLFLVLIGMPVAFAIGIAGCLFFVQNPDLPFTIPVQLTVTQTQNFALLAIPLFIMAGNFMNHSGITARLRDRATVVTGRLRGGLAQVSIALSAFMGGVSGSCIADAAMQSRMLGRQMTDRGFSRGYTAGVIAFGSLLTPVIPPGIGMILYGTVGQVSIGRLFAAGIVPALVLWAAMAATVSWTAKRRGYRPELIKRPSARQVGAAAWAGLWAMLFPVFLLLGLRAGVFTPSEIGAFAVVYAIAVGALAYRALKRRNFAEAIEGSLSDIGAVMFLITLSAVFGYGIVLERVPELVSESIVGLTDNRYGIVLVVLALVVAAGCFVDGTVLIIMLTPIVLPLVTEVGMDPVHFGIVFVIACTIGNFTPPVGAAMFAVCSVLRCPVGEYTRESLPFLVAQLVASAALVFMPALVLWLPDLMFGEDW